MKQVLLLLFIVFSFSCSGTNDVYRQTVIDHLQTEDGIKTDFKIEFQKFKVSDITVADSIKMSRPNIALHKKSNVMKEEDYQYLKRSQKDYSMSFKLAVVKEVEQGFISKRGAMRKYGIQGHGTITEWCRKYGTFDGYSIHSSRQMKTPEQKIHELEQKLRLLERQNKFLEEQLVESEDKAIILDKLIDLAEKKYIIPIRKNSSPEQSKSLAKKGKNP